MNLAFLDDLHAGLEHLDKALAYFRSEPCPAGRYRLGNNPGVVCLTTSAFILWILGHPDRGGNAPTRRLPWQPAWSTP